MISRVIKGHNGGPGGSFVDEKNTQCVHKVILETCKAMTRGTSTNYRPPQTLIYWDPFLKTFLFPGIFLFQKDPYYTPGCDRDGSGTLATWVLV